jgi:hypothetical protein
MIACIAVACIAIVAARSFTSSAAGPGGDFDRLANETPSGHVAGYVAGPFVATSDGHGVFLQEN